MAWPNAEIVFVQRSALSVQGKLFRTSRVHSHSFVSHRPTVAGRLLFKWDITQLTTPSAHMAQTSHDGLLLAESSSIEYVPRLSPPTPRGTSHSSTSSIDSGSNFYPPGEAPEVTTSPTTSLPSFYPSGARDVAPSSSPEETPTNWRDTLFHGWKVVLLSCTPFPYLSFHHLNELRFKGSTFFWCWYQYPCVLLVVNHHMNLSSKLVGNDALHEKYA